LVVVAVLRRVRRRRAPQSVDAMAMVHMIVTLAWLLIALRFVNPTAGSRSRSTATRESNRIRPGQRHNRAAVPKSPI
jgi:hypothetical protein